MSVVIIQAPKKEPKPKIIHNPGIQIVSRTSTTQKKVLPTRMMEFLAFDAEGTKKSFKLESSVYTPFFDSIEEPFQLRKKLNSVLLQKAKEILNDPNIVEVI